MIKLLLKILEFKTAKNAKEYTDAEEINLIRKMIKEREDSATVYAEYHRPDLADKELKQSEVLEQLLPKLPTKEDIESYITEHHPVIDKKQMGLVIK